jgi:hypothetical protein
MFSSKAFIVLSLTFKGRGKGGEMTQTLYAHINKRKKKFTFMHLIHLNCFLLFVCYIHLAHRYPDFPVPPAEKTFQ